VENAGVENAGVDRRGGKCKSGKCGEQTARVENVGVSPMDSQPENKLRWC